MENKNKLSHEQFIEILIFLSQFAGMDDLCDEEAQNEFWEYYTKSVPEENN